MLNQRLWLRSSLYVDRANWGATISYGIKPFIWTLRERKSFHSYYLSFSCLDTENIQLGVLIDGNEAESVALDIDLFFKAFFENFHFHNQEVKDLSSIFMPFPKNSIYYGIFQVPEITKKIPSKLILEMSDIIVEGFAEDRLDEESMLLFSIYQYFGWLRAALLFGDEKIIARAVSFFQQWEYLKAKSVPLFEEIKDDFERNSVILNELFEDVLALDCKDVDLTSTWTQKWISLCLQQLNLKKQSDSKSGYQSFFLIPQIMNHQLGINERKKFLIYCFISRVLANKGLSKNSEVYTKI